MKKSFHSSGKNHNSELTDDHDDHVGAFHRMAPTEQHVGLQSNYFNLKCRFQHHVQES